MRQVGSILVACLAAACAGPGVAEEIALTVPFRSWEEPEPDRQEREHTEAVYRDLATENALQLIQYGVSPRNLVDGVFTFGALGHGVGPRRIGGFGGVQPIDPFGFAGRELIGGWETSDGSTVQIWNDGFMEEWFADGRHEIDPYDPNFDEDGGIRAEDLEPPTVPDIEDNDPVPDEGSGGLGPGLGLGGRLTLDDLRRTEAVDHRLLWNHFGLPMPREPLINPVGGVSGLGIVDPAGSQPAGDDNDSSMPLFGVPVFVDMRLIALINPGWE